MVMRRHTGSPISQFPHAEAVARLRELGGEMLAGLLDLPAGRICVVHDPQGAVFALFEGETDD